MELTEQEKTRTPEEWKKRISMRGIYAFVSGTLVGVGFVTAVICVAFFIV